MKFLYEGWKMIAVQDVHGQWWKVVTDCTRCGKCCSDRKGQVWPTLEDCYIDREGVCKYLSYENEIGKCELGVDRPQICSQNYPHTQPDYCGMVMEKVNDPVSLL